MLYLDMQGSFTTDSANKFLELMAQEGYEVSELSSQGSLENFSGQCNNKVNPWDEKYPDFSDIPGEYVDQEEFAEKEHSIASHKDTVGEVMHRWKHHDPTPLHSGRGKGGKEGKIVKDQDQAIAIALSIAEKKGKKGKGMGAPAKKGKGKSKTIKHAEISPDFSALSVDELLEYIEQPFSLDGEGEFDFTRCVRSDGRAYGTAGTCRKGFHREHDDKYPFKAAVTQGRFNIPHLGHVKLIKKMLEKAPVAYVVLGTGAKNVNRDFRSQMLRAMLRKEGVDLSRVKIMQGTHINPVINDLSKESGSKKVVAMLGEDQKGWLKSMKKEGVHTQIVPRSAEASSSSAIRKMVDSKDEAALKKEFGNDPYLVRLAKVARKIEKNEFSEFDFTRCERPDGSAYGTSGKCRKGTQVEKEEHEAIHQLASMLPKGERIVDSTGKTHTVGGEAVKHDKVSEKNYSWGKLMKVSKGSDYSAILHPEHQDALKKLKDGESTRFRDETNTDWTAKRNGDTVELSARGMKLNFPHSALAQGAPEVKERTPKMPGLRAETPEKNLNDKIKEALSKEMAARRAGDQEEARKHMKEHMRLVAEADKEQQKTKSSKKITPEEYNRMLQKDLVKLPDGRVARRHEIRSPYET